MTKEELEKENANLKALRKYELNVAKLEIEKLEQRNAELIALINAERERQEKCDDVHLRKIAELERKNAELDCQMNRNKYCYSCVNAADRCFRNEIGCPCEKYKSHKDEITELKEKVSYLEDNLRVVRKDRENLQLKVGKDLKEFKKDCPYSAEQLTKAKEIIKDYMTIAKGTHTAVCGVPEENRTIYVLQLNEEAEEFLNSEVEQ